MRMPKRITSLISRWTPKQQQYMAAAAIFILCVGFLWAVLTYSESGRPQRAPMPTGAQRATVNVDGGPMMVPGEVSAEDQWVGNAGKKLAQYDSDKEAQERFNSDRKVAEAALLKRLGDLEAKSSAADAPIAQGPTTPASTPPVQPPPVQPPPVQPPLSAPPVLTASQYPPGTPPGGMSSPATGTLAPSAGLNGQPLAVEQSAGPPPMIHVSLATDADTVVVKGTGKDAGVSPAAVSTLDDYLPVGILPGILLGGIDAPTGGQAQGNPMPVLIRIVDNAILPNRFRAEVKECFVVAAGYGDISSERAYMRADVLSCVRHDQSVVEVKIEGNVFGEDGNYGMRGTLVSKQGQLLANALRAGIVSGIGQGFSQGATTFTNSPFGTLSTTSGGTAEQMRRGIGGGVGQALNNLANYYIKLAEQTFPVIEVHAGRTVDVVLTKGVRIPARPTGVSDPTGARFGFYDRERGGRDDEAD